MLGNQIEARSVGVPASVRPETLTMLFSESANAKRHSRAVQVNTSPEEGRGTWTEALAPTTLRALRARLDRPNWRRGE
jgi:hypothetical protein